MSTTDTASNENKMPLYIAIMVFIASLVALLMAAGQGNATQTMGQREPVSVVLTKVEMRQQFETPINVFGLIESPKSTLLSFDSSGEVTEVLVEEGDTVSKGDVLARLDTQRLVAQQKELSASLERVKADLNLAKINNDRTQSLVKKKLESAQRLDETQAALNVAAARVNEISASLNSMNVALDRAILYAPFDGQVDSRLFDEGSVINAGMAVIGVTSNDKYQARFAVPADIVDQFEIGESVTMQVGESDVQGTVSQRLAVRNVQTRTVDILVSLSSNTQVRPGDMAILSGSRIHTEQGAWLPVSALSNGLRGLWRVLVLDNQGGDNGVGTLQARVVDVVYTDGSKAFVRGALKEQEQVVVGGTHKLAPGQRVKAGTASAELGEMLP